MQDTSPEPSEPPEEDEIDAQERAFWRRLRPSPGVLVIFVVLQICPGFLVTSTILMRLVGDNGWIWAMLIHLSAMLVLFHIAVNRREQD
jgi:hypothetical protein